ncbi:GFA family protein [Brevundimonas lutea]|uniref:GFA family protein n=1 Tax=Brevundimonas lutea TaxID=2293980 RepID=UPI001F0C750C|nr:hypothetical protein [Brevundimonas lutea]
MTKTHTGSCHCGAVSFEVEMDLEGLIECNCSHCYRKGFVLKFVEPSAFRLISGEGAQAQYGFSSTPSTTCSARPAASRASRVAGPRTARR